MNSAQAISDLAKQRMSAILTCLILTTFAAGYTWWQLDQIKQGQLFMVELSGERPASSYELFDAEQSASQYLVPGILCVVLLGSLAIYLVIRWDQLSLYDSNTWRVLVAVLVVCAIVDLATTIRFFHNQGIQLELHPGIRLFGYAYGRTIGPILGKTIQVSGIVCISRLLGKAGTVLLAIAAVMYIAAGIYNSLQA